MRIIDVASNNYERFYIAFLSWETQDETSKWKMMTVFLLF